jgi:hypothetical protein
MAFVNTGTDGQISVTLRPADTSPLAGFYNYVAQLTDQNGLVFDFALGRMQVGLQPSWSYSGDPSTSTRDAVRFYVGDTVEASPLYSNAEIDFAIAQSGGAQSAAASLLMGLATRYANLVDKAVGDLRISLSQRYKQYLAQAKQMRTAGATAGMRPYTGGVSVVDKNTVVMNSDRVQQVFVMGQFDMNPPAGDYVPATGGAGGQWDSA